MLAQSQRPAVGGEGRLVDQLRADLGQRAFVVMGITVKQFTGKRELKDRIAQVFEPLVVIRLAPNSWDMDGCVSASRNSIGSRNWWPRRVWRASRLDTKVGVYWDFSSPVPASAATGGCSGGTT